MRLKLNGEKNLMVPFMVICMLPYKYSMKMNEKLMKNVQVTSPLFSVLSILNLIKLFKEF